MLKTVCDFCGNITDEAVKYKFPAFVVHQATNKAGEVLKEFCNGEVEDVEKDVCPTCRKNIAMFVNDYARISFAKKS